MKLLHKQIFFKVKQTQNDFKRYFFNIQISKYLNFKKIEKLRISVSQTSVKKGILNILSTIHKL